jgi:hypothetical protein
VAAKIFINYRREDAKAEAARLRDRLAQVFGAGNIFMDVDNLLPGERFDLRLQQALAEADIFLVVIGSRWMEHVTRRMELIERDFVREEIAAALAKEITIIPILMDRAPVPSAASLPEDICGLVFHQKQDIEHESFGRDVAALIEAIGRARYARRAQRRKQRTAPWGVLAAALLLFGAATPASLYVDENSIRQLLSFDTESPGRRNKAEDRIRREAEAAKAKERAEEAQRKREEADRARKAADAEEARRKLEGAGLAASAAKNLEERRIARSWKELIPSMNGAVTAIAISDDGTKVAAGTQSGSIKVLRVEGFDKLQEISTASLQPPARISALAFAANGSGRLGAAAQDGSIAIYDTKPATTRLLGKPDGAAEGSKRWVPAWAAAAGGFVALSVVETSGRRVVQTERWQPDGKPAGSPVVLETGERGIMAAAFAPKLGRFAAAPRQDDSGSGEILIFTLGDSRPATTLTRTGATPLAIAFSPGERAIAVAGQADYVELWEGDGNWDKKEPEKLRLLTDSLDHDVTALAFSPDNRFLASADEQGNIYYWDLRSKPRLARRIEGTPKQHVPWLAFLRGFDGDAVLLSPWNNGSVYRIAFGGG